MKNYQNLLAFAKKIALLSSTEALLSWDMETYMPKLGAEYRSDQVALLATLIHEKKSSKKFSSLLNSCIDVQSGDYKISDLDEDQKAALREWRKDFQKTIKLPKKFVEKFAKTTSTAINVWAQAKKQNDFQLFLPHLEKIVQLNIQKASLLGFDEDPYDALLDLFEPEMKVKKLDPIFFNLKNFLIQLLQKIQSKAQVNDSFLNDDYPADLQIKIGKKLFSLLQIDENNCRLDLSVHPFSTSIGPKDVRMTSRIQKDLMSNLFSILHESGHSIYDMQLPKEYYGSPLSEAVSLGIHESQSRTWETLIGKSKSFCSLLLPILKEFCNNLKNISINDFYRAINKVSPSFIRVEADEITYPLHIIVRYEIEKDLINKRIKAKDVPHFWNEKMEKYLTIKPKNDAEGALQDIHWSMGSIGYFPTYALGNIYAAHFFEGLKRDLPNYQQIIERGEFNIIKKWLFENIHRFGRKYSGEQLALRVTKEPLSEKAYTRYLNEKYSVIYGF